MIAVAVVLIAVIVYAAAGFAYAATRISSADRTLNNVISHQNQLNTTFHDIDTKFSALGSSTAFNPTQARAVIDQFVANAQAAGKTVDEDDAALATATNGLNDQSWLTVISRSNLDREAHRIGHARNALASARIVAADYVLDGRFLQAFMDSIADLDNLGNQTSSADFAGARATLGTMKSHVDNALQLSTAPGLPSELHSLMIDFQTLVTDFGKLVDAAQANDDAGITSAEQNVQNDGRKISSYDFDKMTSEIDAYFKPMVDRFNRQMAAATA